MHKGRKKKITDPHLLARIADQACVLQNRVAAVERLDDPSAIRALAAKPETPVDVRLAAIGKTEDQDQALLERLAQEDPNPDVRIRAVEKMTQQQPLLQIAAQDEDIRVRIAAAGAMTEPQALCRLAIQTDEYAVSEYIIEQLDAASLNMTFYTAFCRAKAEPAYARLQIRILAKMWSPERPESPEIIVALSGYLNHTDAAPYAVAALEKIYKRLGVISIIRHTGDYPRQRPHRPPEA